MPMPVTRIRPRPTLGTGASGKSGNPGFAPGSPGSGDASEDAQTPEAVVIITSEDETGSGNISSARGRVAPQEYGSASNHPYTTSRVDVGSTNVPSRYYPYAAAGKIYFNDGLDTVVCTGSLIKKGLIVTAAHCVADFGTNQFYSGWQYIPALSGKKKPFGTWAVTEAWVKNSYLDGTDNCSDPPVVCENDVAILVVKPKGKVYPGKKTGWFGYAWDGAGFAPTSPAVVLINQLGYPTSHDGGLMMQRTDSQGFVSLVDANNTVWGSRQTGGSSGGPELVNLGIAPVLSEGVLLAQASAFNTVVGVTSWAYTDEVTKQEGASPFTSGNIVSLVDSACLDAPAACAP